MHTRRELEISLYDVPNFARFINSADQANHVLLCAPWSTQYGMRAPQTSGKKDANIALLEPWFICGLIGLFFTAVWSLCMTYNQICNAETQRGWVTHQWSELRTASDFQELPMLRIFETSFPSHNMQKHICEVISWCEACVPKHAFHSHWMREFIGWEQTNKGFHAFCEELLFTVPRQSTPNKCQLHCLLSQHEAYLCQVQRVLANSQCDTFHTVENSVFALFCIQAPNKTFPQYYFCSP